MYLISSYSEGMLELSLSYSNYIVPWFESYVCKRFCLCRPGIYFSIRKQLADSFFRLYTDAALFLGFCTVYPRWSANWSFSNPELIVLNPSEIINTSSCHIHAINCFWCNDGILQVHKEVVICRLVAYISLNDCFILGIGYLFLQALNCHKIKTIVRTLIVPIDEELYSIEWEWQDITIYQSPFTCRIQRLTWNSRPTTTRKYMMLPPQIYSRFSPSAGSLVLAPNETLYRLIICFGPGLCTSIVHDIHSWRPKQSEHKTERPTQPLPDFGKSWGWKTAADRGLFTVILIARYCPMRCLCTAQRHSSLCPGTLA